MSPAPIVHRLRTAGLLLAFWTGLGVLFALPGLNETGRFRLQLADAIVQWWAWGLVSLVIVAVDRRLPFGDRQIALRVLAHVPLGVAFTIAYMYVAAGIRAAIGLGPWQAVWSRELLVMALRVSGRSATLGGTLHTTRRSSRRTCFARRSRSR